MIFSWTDLYAVGVIAVYIAICSFAWWLPLTALWKNGQLALRWTMPVSFSIQILVGYAFYSAGFMGWYVPVYGGIVLLAQVLVLTLWRKRLLELPKLPRLSPWYWGMAGLAIVVVVVTRLYDPLTTLAPGNNDSLNHLRFLYDLYDLGHLSNTYYAPGYHLVFAFLTELLDQVAVYRWIGPVTGIALASGIYLFVQAYVKQPMVRWLYVIASSSFFLQQWVLQTMSLFSTALTFLYIFAFLTLLSDTAMMFRRRLGLFSLLGLALALTVPYFFIQFFFVSFGLLVVSGIWRKTLAWKQLLAYTGIIVVCIMVGVGHVYFQTRVLQRGGGFPEIPIISTDTNQVTTLKSNYDDSVTERPTTTSSVVIEPITVSTTPIVTEENFTDRMLTRLSEALPYSLYQQQLRPLVTTAVDVIKIKQFRPLNSVLSIGAYVWIGMSLLMLISGLRQKSIWWVTMSVASLVYGWAIQTGSLELSFYRGRSGWYLLWLALYGSILVFDRLYRPSWRWPVIIGGLILAVTAVIFPPQFYRPYYEEVFDASYEVVTQVNGSRAAIITRQPLLALLHQDAVVLPYDVSAVTTLPGSEKNRYIIYEKDFFSVDPLLSQQGLSGDADFSTFYQNQKLYKSALDQTNAAILAAPEFADYQVVWENEHIVIYHLVLP